MNMRATAVLMIGVAIASASPVRAQLPRTDARRADSLSGGWHPRARQLWVPAPGATHPAVDNPPIFKGRWAPDPVCDCATGQVVPRTAPQIAAWDARTVVNGTTNSDAAVD